MQDGKPNSPRRSQTSLTTSLWSLPTQPLTPGNHILRVKFDYERGGIEKGATAKMLVDEEEVGQVKIPKTIGVHFSLDQTFDVGEDTGTPVLEDYADKMPFKSPATSRSS
jgi:arylsulfatase